MLIFVWQACCIIAKTCLEPPCLSECWSVLQALPVDKLPGVGPSTRMQLAELGVHSVEDVLVRGVGGGENKYREG